MTKTQNVQDRILFQVQQDQTPVTVFLMNGFQLRGHITGYDSFVVMLETDGRQQMIYKHAISTITPTRSVPLKTGSVG